jgi:hypothetical protein
VVSNTQAKCCNCPAALTQSVLCSEIHRPSEEGPGISLDRPSRHHAWLCETCHVKCNVQVVLLRAWESIQDVPVPGHPTAVGSSHQAASPAPPAHECRAICSYSTSWHPPLLVSRGQRIALSGCRLSSSGGAQAFLTLFQTAAWERAGRSAGDAAVCTGAAPATAATRWRHCCAALPAGAAPVPAVLTGVACDCAG